MLCQYMQVYISSRMPGPEATHLHASRIKHVLRIIISYIITMENKKPTSNFIHFLIFSSAQNSKSKKKINYILSNFSKTNRLIVRCT